MKKILIFFLSSTSAIFNKIGPFQKLNDEMGVVELAQFHGYPILNYRVVTADGYILQLNRIPGKKGTKIVENLREHKQSVLMMHGLFSDALSWIITGDRDGNGKGLPYQMVDTGDYDVWLINWRGVKRSRYHTWMSPDTDKNFWNYGFEEIGEYDLRACLDFIKAEKNSDDKIQLISYSEGTMASFYALSEDPDYYDKTLSLFVALSPTILFKHAGSPIMRELASAQLVQDWIKEQGFLEIFGKNGNKQLLLKDIRKNYPWFCDAVPIICQKIQRSEIEDQAGKDPYDGTNVTLQDEFKYKWIIQNGLGGSCGTSLKNMMHLSQMMNTGKFMKYDYGPSENYKLYGQFNAPEIQIDNISIPTGLFVGLQDNLADVTDCEVLKKQIKKLVAYETFEINHIGMIIGPKMDHGKKLIELMDRYRK